MEQEACHSSGYPETNMRNMWKFLTAACLPLIAIGIAMAADINGNWTTTIDTMMGPMKWSYVFKVDGAKLTGTATNNDGKATAIEEGKVDGDKISFVENMNIEGLGPTKIENTGTIVSADEIQIHRKVGMIAAEDFVVKRVK